MSQIVDVVLSDFIDIEDNRHIYRKGQSYPRVGKKVTDERVERLRSTNNLLKKSLIVKIDNKLTKNDLLEVAEICGVKMSQKDTKDNIIEEIKRVIY